MKGSAISSSIRARTSIPSGVFEGIVVATALVLVINAVLVAIDRRYSAWRPTDREMEL